MSKRLEENHQALIADTFKKWHIQIKIWWEIYDILQKWDKFKLEFSHKDPDSIFYIDQN
jgi:hypothetical protein